MKVAVLMTCFNRRTYTLSALDSLSILQGTPRCLRLEIFLVDDGSTDGTTAAVERRHPTVRVVQGTGSLYWNGGMVRAYRAALAEAGDFDAFLLANDDVEMNIEACVEFFTTFEHLNDIGPTILVGATMDRAGRKITYGGFLEKSRLRALSFERVPLNDEKEPIPCDTFNANFVLVPGDLFRRLGGLDPRYSHGFGDLDLGLRAREAGAKALVFPKPIGVCSKGPSIDERLLMMSRPQRAWAILIHPHGLRPYLTFCWRHRPKVMFPAYLFLTTASRLSLISKRTTR